MGGTEALIAAGLGALQTLSSVAASRRDASYARQQGDRARAEAAADAVEQRRQNRRELARGRAQLGAAGITVEGSPVEVLADLAGEGELQARKIENQGEAAANAQAYRALEAESRAGDALLGGIGRAAGSVATAGRGYGLWDQEEEDADDTSAP